MAAPLSPNHVFDFPADEPHDFDDSDLEFEEEPKEEPDGKMRRSLKRILKKRKKNSSADSELTTPVTANGTHWVPPSGSTFEVGEPSSAPSLQPHLLTRRVKRLRDDTEILFSGMRCLERGARTRQTKIDANRSGINKLSGRMDAFNTNLGFIEGDATRTSDYVLVSERLGWGAMEARPSDSNDVLAVYIAAQPPEP
ncbi:hypothetical protein Tco_0385026 [Tanacetum coccineum]